MCLSRRDEALTINRIVRRISQSADGKRKGVTNDLINCISEFEIFIDPMLTEATLNLNDSSSKKRDDKEMFLDGVALAEATMNTTNARFEKTLGMKVDRKAVVDAMPQISLVATGVVGFEPPTDEPEWCKEFFSDIYWQRHSNLRRSKASYIKSIDTLVHRPSFR